MVENEKYSAAALVPELSGQLAEQVHGCIAEPVQVVTQLIILPVNAQKSMKPKGVQSDQHHLTQFTELENCTWTLLCSLQDCADSSTCAKL